MNSARYYSIAIQNSLDWRERKDYCLLHGYNIYMYVSKYVNFKYVLIIATSNYAYMMDSPLSPEK